MYEEKSSWVKIRDMLCVNHVVKPLPPRNKMNTWKFAARYVWKDRFTEDKGELGRWTKNQLLDLGPTFVKLGQIASTRSDLYPPEFIKELESLQDDVPPFDYNLVKDNLNMEIFQEFEQIPFKSASIGQVHKAVLKKRETRSCKIKKTGYLRDNEIRHCDGQKDSDFFTKCRC